VKKISSPESRMLRKFGLVWTQYALGMCLFIQSARVAETIGSDEIPDRSLGSLTTKACDNRDRHQGEILRRSSIMDGNRRRGRLALTKAKELFEQEFA